MLFNIDILQLILMSALFGYCIGEMNDSVDVRKRCVQFEMEDHSSTAAAIGRQYDVSKSQCLVSCARNRSCNAFNFRHIHGLCELLKISVICMSHKVTYGTTLVRLSKCEAKPKPPWKVIIPTQRKLQWMEPHVIGWQRVILTTPDPDRSIARVLHKGTYLSGYVINDDFRGRQKDNNFKCNEAFQLLTYAQSSDYLWSNFTPGDYVPPSAVIGGYSRDKIPLYVISVKLDEWKSGYYNIDTKETYVKYKKSVKAEQFRLLLENIWIKTIFW